MNIKMYRYLIQDLRNPKRIFWTNWTSEFITPNDYNRRFSYTILFSYESLKNYDNKPDACKILKVEVMDEKY